MPAAFGKKRRTKKSRKSSRMSGCGYTLKRGKGGRISIVKVYKSITHTKGRKKVVKKIRSKGRMMALGKRKCYRTKTLAKKAAQSMRKKKTTRRSSFGVRRASFGKTRKSAFGMSRKTKLPVLTSVLGFGRLLRPVGL